MIYKMKKIWIVNLILILNFSNKILGAEEIYTSSDNICKTCKCISEASIKFTLDCSSRSLSYMLNYLPEIWLGLLSNQTGLQLDLIMSGNALNILQTLPITNADVFFSCRYCDIGEIKAGAFIDVSNIRKLDLSYNRLTGENLVSDTFRGKYNENNKHEPISLEMLNLGHNQITALYYTVFKHTPNLQRLNLTNNPLKLIDESTATAISSLTNLEILDLSYTQISELPKEMFTNLTKLSVLFLQGNLLHEVPSSLSYIKNSLKSLHIGENLIEILYSESFLGFKELIFLNISSSAFLYEVKTQTFETLESLEILIAFNNTDLQKFDFSSLKSLKNFKELDLRKCALKTFEITTEESSKEDDSDEKYFPSFQTLKLEQNPWHCDCQLLKYLSKLNYYTKLEHHDVDNESRCKTPYALDGTLLYDLIKEPVCNINAFKKPRIPEKDPPPFLRRRSIVTTILSVVLVLLIGLIIGFGIVCFKKRMRKNEMNLPLPVQYTTGRSSMGPLITT